MWLIATVVLVSVGGLGLAGTGLVLLTRAVEPGLKWYSSTRTWGAISIFLAGCSLLVGGQYKLYRLFYASSSQAQAVAQMHVTLLVPLETLEVRIYGDNPFRNADAPARLRLHVTTLSERTFASDLSRDRLKPSSQPAAGWSAYTVPWSAVVATVAPSDDGLARIATFNDLVGGLALREERELAASFVTFNDLRRLESLRAEIILPSGAKPALPDSIRLYPNNKAHLELFRGKRVNSKVAGPGDQIVHSYRDDVSALQHIADWEYSITPADTKVGVILWMHLAAAAILLAVGVGALLIGQTVKP